jgi:hypothetical protein
MKLPFFYNVILCDPVSAAIGLGAALVGTAGTLLAPKPKTPAPPNVPAPPPPIQQPQGTPATAGGTQQAPSFLAAAAAPAQANTIGGAGKTLLGQ